MPSDRKQFNVRADGETEERVGRLLASVKASLGLAVTISDLFRMGMIELERKYPSAETPKADAPAEKPKRSRKPKGDVK